MGEYNCSLRPGSKGFGKLGVHGVMIYIEVWDKVSNEATDYDVMPLCF